jgi:predicted O-methyltransferase YrrM
LPADFVLVDGPPNPLGGRLGSLVQAVAMSRRGAVVLLHDSRESGVPSALRALAEEFVGALEIREIAGFVANLTAHIVCDPLPFRAVIDRVEFERVTPHGVDPTVQAVPSPETASSSVALSHPTKNAEATRVPVRSRTSAMRKSHAGGVARVEAIVVNYKRPRNVLRIVAALRDQSEPCDVTLIDAAAGAEFALDQEAHEAADRVFSLDHNFGPYNRFVPLAAFASEFTYFQDDDMVPGRRVIEHFLRAADTLGTFGVLGQDGRIVDADGTYHVVGVPRTLDFQPVDIVCRGYFVRTSNLPAVVRQRFEMSLIPDESLEDDLLLCTAMNMVCGLGNYLTPIDPDGETLMNRQELPDDFARCRRHGHARVRTEFCRAAMAVGWTPMRAKASAHDRNPPAAEANATAQSNFDVNAYWLKRGQSYMREERLFSEPYLLQEQFILDAITSSRRSIANVLEIGCGFGRITKRIAQAFPDAQITAVDLSLDQLNNARLHCAEYLDRIRLIECDLQAGTPLPGTGYDLALAVEVLMHQPYNVVLGLLEALSRVASLIVNYDWSEDFVLPKSPHVWVHDYEEIYKSLGLQCEVVLEPRKFNGQQQKLFVAYRPGS